MAYEQIEISFDPQLELQLRTENAARLAQEEEAGREGGDNKNFLPVPPMPPGLSSAPSNGHARPQESAEQSASDAQSAPHAAPPPPEYRRGLPPFAIDGEIKLDYTFERFNARGDYFEERADLSKPFKTALLAAGQLRHPTREAVFTHKGDGSRIVVCKNKIICDNTDGNIQSALDIAQDKGWQVIKITGGSRKAKAEMWYQAQMRGLETTGYNPTEADRKRLLGAQERQQAEQAAHEAKEGEKLSEALDIKPKADVQQETGGKSAAADRTTPATHQPEQAENAQTQHTLQSDKTVAERSADRPTQPSHESPEQPGRESADKSGAKVSTQETGATGHTLSRDQQFEYARKQIMAEVEKVMPLNEQQYHDLEVMVDKQLAVVAANGKTLNVDKAKEAIRSGLPVIRHELESAAKAEQRQADKDRNRNPAARSASQSHPAQRERQELER